MRRNRASAEPSLLGMLGPAAAARFDDGLRAGFLASEILVSVIGHRPIGL